MVKVYDRNMEIIANVDYNNNLDYWTGQNWQNGGTGKHRGLTQLEDGRLVIIYGSDWQGTKDYGEIISKAEAIQEIVDSGNEELLEEFNLTEEYEQTMVKEKNRNPDRREEYIRRVVKQVQNLPEDSALEEIVRETETLGEDIYKEYMKQKG